MRLDLRKEALPIFWKVRPGRAFDETNPLNTAPTLTAALNGSDIDLDWLRERGYIATYYDVYRRVNGTGDFVFLATVAAPTREYTDTNATIGVLHEYYVIAYNLEGETTTSNTVSLTPPIPMLSSIIIGQGPGGFMGRFTINPTTGQLTAPLTEGVDYYHDGTNLSNTRIFNSAVIENGYLHAFANFGNSEWWRVRLSDFAFAKIWANVAAIPPHVTDKAGRFARLFNSGGGYFSSDTVDAGRTGYTNNGFYGPIGGINTTSINNAGKHAVDSAGRVYWLGAGGIHRGTALPVPLNDGVTIDSNIGTISGMVYSWAPLALYQDGAYVLVVQSDSSTTDKRGCWLHVVRISDGNVASIDLNTTPNTLVSTNQALTVTVDGTLAFVTRLDGFYTNGTVGTRRLAFIIDLSDPDAPVLASTLTTNTNGETYVKRVNKYDTKVYFTMSRYIDLGFPAYSGSWFIFDVADPYNPTLFVAEAIPGPPQSVTYSDTWAISEFDEAVDGGDKYQIGT